MKPHRRALGLMLLLVMSGCHSRTLPDSSTHRPDGIFSHGMNTSSSNQRQITRATHGHILTNTGVWSPDGEWIVYDIRSDAAGDRFDGTRIEMVHVRTGEVRVLYESTNGAHCGV